jgi:hypothetical protein
MGAAVNDKPGPAGSNLFATSRDQSSMEVAMLRIVLFSVLAMLALAALANILTGHHSFSYFPLLPIFAGAAIACGVLTAPAPQR